MSIEAYLLIFLNSDSEIFKLKFPSLDWLIDELYLDIYSFKFPKFSKSSYSDLFFLPLFSFFWRGDEELSSPY